MKGTFTFSPLTFNSDCFYDFCLQTDAQGFLEQTLASEKLSRTALEHRTRLLVKLTGLMKEYDNHQMEMYIDMSPALRSFFHPSDSSTSDNSSVKDTGMHIKRGGRLFVPPIKEKGGERRGKNNSKLLYIYKSR